MTILFATLLVATLIAIAWIDMREQRIPDRLNLLLAALGVLHVLWATPDRTLVALLTGMALFALFWSVREVHLRLTGRIGLGLGDVKFAGAAGIWLEAWQLPLFMLTSAGGALVFVAGLGLAGRFRSRLPFGPFLCIGVITCRFVARLA